MDVLIDTDPGMPTRRICWNCSAVPTSRSRQERSARCSAHAVGSSFVRRPYDRRYRSTDPEAAQIVLESGVRPVLVGLDVCHQTHFTNRQIAATGLKTELGRFVARACESWLPAAEAGEDEGPNLYDTLAVAGAFRPELLTVEPAFVQIETASEAGAGTNMAWLPSRASVWSRPNGADNALVATGVDIIGFEAPFTERVLAQL